MNVSNMWYPACHVEEGLKVWKIYSLPSFLSCLLLLNFYRNSEVACVDQIYHINHIQTHIQFVSAVSEHQSLCGRQHSTHSILNMC